VTPVGWLALAAALGFAGGRAGPGRLGALVAAGRLAPVVGDEHPRRRGGFPALGRARRATVRQRQLRAALGALTAELTAGGRPPAAFEAAAAAAPGYAEVFGPAARAAAEGGDVADVLRIEPSTAALAAAWELAERAGIATAAAVDRVAADLDAMEEQRRALAVALAGPRSSAAVLAGLPLLGLLLGAGMGADPVHVLFRTSAGPVLAAVGVGLDVAGLFWMRRILRWAESA